MFEKFVYFFIYKVLYFVLFSYFLLSGYSLATAQTKINQATALPQLAPIPRSAPRSVPKQQLSFKSVIELPRVVFTPRFRPALGATSNIFSTDPPATLDAMIGQMLMVGFKGTDASHRWPKILARQIKSGQVGGVLFLGHNVRSASGVRSLTKLFRSTGADVMPFISIDQEGGLVERLGKTIGFEEIPSASQMARLDINKAQIIYSDLAKRLKQWGFNTNYGPVLDIVANPDNPIIAKKGRAYSSDSRIAATYGQAFVNGHRNAGMVTALKHFPGHGSSRQDSHLGFTNISRTWNAKELKPFQSLIQQDAADMVMVGHLYLENYAPNESKEVPASLSRPLVQGLLRDQMGYQGVVVTDDLDMGAIRQNFTQNETILRAVAAGVDVLILSNSARPDPNLPNKVIQMLKQEANRNPSLRRNIEASYRRIMTLKQRFLYGG